MVCAWPTTSGSATSGSTRPRSSAREARGRREDAAHPELAGDDEDADVFVLSSQYFVSVPADVFASAVRRHLPEWAGVLRPVCYLRPHGPRLVSAFAQRRRDHGLFTVSFTPVRRASVERRGWLKYATLLAASRERVRRSAQGPGLLRGTLVGGDVVLDFLHLATSGAEVKVDAERLNPAMSVRRSPCWASSTGRSGRARSHSWSPSGSASPIDLDLDGLEVGRRGHRLALSAGADPDARGQLQRTMPSVWTRRTSPTVGKYVEHLHGSSPRAPPRRRWNCARSTTRPPDVLQSLRLDAERLAAVCV